MFLIIEMINILIHKIKYTTGNDLVVLYIYIYIYISF